MRMGTGVDPGPGPRRCWRSEDSAEVRTLGKGLGQRRRLREAYEHACTTAKRPPVDLRDHVSHMLQRAHCLCDRRGCAAGAVLGSGRQSRGCSHRTDPAEAGPPSAAPNPSVSALTAGSRRTLRTNLSCNRIGWSRPRLLNKRRRSSCVPTGTLDRRGERPHLQVSTHITLHSADPSLAQYVLLVYLN